MGSTSLYRAEDGSINTDLEVSEIHEVIEARRGLLWVHIAEPDDADADLLRRVFGFHPLAVQDCLSADQGPKIDDFGSHIFMMAHGIDHAATAELVETTDLDLFVGSRFVVSTSLRRLPSIEHLMSVAAVDTRLLERGSPGLAHAILDTFIDAVSPTIERMREVADTIEEEALGRPSDSLLASIRALRRSALRIQRVMDPQRELLLRLARGDYAVIGADQALYFRDIYDHVDRIEAACSALRERADFALTTYLSTLNLRQNETMRLLSIVAAVFLPLTLVAGIYGMNFEHMPELGWRYAYPAVIGGMVTFASAVVWALWGRQWLQRERRRLTAPLHFGVDPTLLREARLEASRLRLAVTDLTHLRRHDPED